MISTLYRGSVKDLLGPVQVISRGAGVPAAAVLFRYSDAYSVFDWGKMPDALPNRGASLAILASWFFERIEDPATWKGFSKTPEALAVRKGMSALSAEGAPSAPPGASRFAPGTSLATVFNELGERLQDEGLATHYLGVLPDDLASLTDGRSPLPTNQIQDASEVFRHVAVRQVSVVKPEVRRVLGREVMDYHPTRSAKRPALVPLEVVFRFSCPEGSSLLERVARDPKLVESFLLPAEELKRGIAPGVKWDFPLMELFTKLETRDRPVSLTEALAISGVSAEQLQDILMRTAWIAGYLKHVFGRAGLELADGKLEWAVGEDGKVFLVDAIGPDELRLLKDGVQLSKEFLRQCYRKTEWYERVKRAKAEADSKGLTEWKKLVTLEPPKLPTKVAELVGDLYMALANEITGKRWFGRARSLGEVVKGLREAAQADLWPEQPRTVALIGSGAREHALAWKLAQSPKVGRMIAIPGNDGMESMVTRTGHASLDRWAFSLDSTSFGTLAEKIRAEGVDLVVVGPDNPLADGIVDAFEARGLRCFGPRAAAARIESSKAFAKDVMKAAGVPTAKFEVFEKEDAARAFLESADWSDGGGWVVKADGLALGKGVEVCALKEEALAAVDRLFPLSKRLVIEERLRGEELSWMAFCDGEDAALFEPARDYKRLLDEDRGPNTGGMGAYSPVPEVNTATFRERVRREVFLPTLKELKRRGCAFRGLLYAGLMIDRTRDRLWVIEFNARFGDPEAQVLLPRIEGDLYPWLEAVANGALRERGAVVPFVGQAAVYVVGAAEGYPELPKKGVAFEVPKEEGAYFFAGAKKPEGGNGVDWVTNGGRVFGALGMGDTVEDAARAAYARIRKVKVKAEGGGGSGLHFRTDIAGGEK